jgi:hypothetical protein
MSSVPLASSASAVVGGDRDDGVAVGGEVVGEEAAGDRVGFGEQDARGAMVHPSLRSVGSATSE